MTKFDSFEADVSALKPNPWNTNVVSPDNELKIENSIKRFGIFRPIIVRTLSDGSYEILGGEHRWTVAKRLGYQSVPVVNLGSIDDTRAKEIGLVDNGRYGEDDALSLSELLKDLGGADEVLDFLPYTGDELEAIFSSSSIALDDIDMPDDSAGLPDASLAKAPQTHQIMRFKVPVEDADHVTRLIEATMKSQGYTEDDSMTNAGHALVHLLRSAQ